ncbi:hypothetical protein M3Y96_00399100 [Aphelenchoides besseyi]|nr:hypothetical protein M3Y96_00399100 [Aphelenchoides besseyi]
MNSLDLIKVSATTSEKIRKPAINWKELGISEVGFHDRSKIIQKTSLICFRWICKLGMESDGHRQR